MARMCVNQGGIFTFHPTFMMLSPSHTVSRFHLPASVVEKTCDKAPLPFYNLLVLQWARTWNLGFFTFPTTNPSLSDNSIQRSVFQQWRSSCFHPYLTSYSISPRESCLGHVLWKGLNQGRDHNSGLCLFK